MDQVRHSKEAVPTQALLVIRGIVAVFLGIIACPLARLGIDVASMALSDRKQYKRAHVGWHGSYRRAHDKACAAVQRTQDSRCHHTRARGGPLENVEFQLPHTPPVLALRRL